MLFNSIHFLVFFPVVVLAYFLLPHRARWVWLLAASYYFYMAWNPRFAVLLAISTVTTYFSGILIARAERIEGERVRKRMKNLWVALSFLVNLGLLFFFKYINFAFKSVSRILALVGEVIHGDYTRWVNGDTLHSVTNYNLHKALYSGHNDHNFFEIAHTVKRLYEMGGSRPDGLKLYNFVDNHDVERIYSKLNNKAHFTPVHILLYTLPGVPSIYYGSEFGIEGKKDRYSDDSLRPALSLEDFSDAAQNNAFTRLIAALGKTRQSAPALSYGDYKELLLTNRQYAFSRNFNGESVIVTVNNDDSDYVMTLPAGNAAEYIGALSGEKKPAGDGRLVVNVKANSGDIWLPLTGGAAADVQTVNVLVMDAADTANAAEVNRAEQANAANTAEANHAEQADVCSSESAAVKENTAEESAAKNTADAGEAAGAAEAAAVHDAADAAKEPETANDDGAAAGTGSDSDINSEAFEKGRIAGLQEAILAIMEKNGPVTEQMRRDVMENVYHDSLVNWVKSFR